MSTPQTNPGWITREYIQSLRDTHLFIYSDNYYNVGAGQQASIARGEPNTIGFPTCLCYASPHGSAPQLFDDKFIKINCRVIMAMMEVFDRVYEPSKYGKNVIIFPKIGHGFADMPNKCPGTYKYLLEQLEVIKQKARIV